MFPGRAGGNRTHQDRYACSNMLHRAGISGEHLHQALHLHPCLSLLLLPCPTPCCPKDAANR